MTDFSAAILRRPLRRVAGELTFLGLLSGPVLIARDLSGFAFSSLSKIGRAPPPSYRNANVPVDS
jgi:hypothetical protein